MIQMSPLRVSATRSARRPPASTSSGTTDAPHLDQQALHAPAHAHRALGLASVDSGLTGNRRHDRHGPTMPASGGGLKARTTKIACGNRRSPAARNVSQDVSFGFGRHPP
jgi:hypothetical protein